MQLVHEECAQGTAEYGLILALVVLVILTSLDQLIKAIPIGIQNAADELSK